MADDNFEEELTEVEEAPLSSEELFELHKAEIDAAFTEKGFFQRIKEMFSGLSKSKTSAEYKLARTELQRLKAPVLAIIVPILVVTVLIVVTAVQGPKDEERSFEVATPDEEEDKPEDEPEKPPEPQEIPDDIPPIEVDIPITGPVSDVVSPAPVSDQPVSMKPAERDTVSLVKSPVMMRSMSSSRTPGMIGVLTKGGAGIGDPTTEAAVLKALRWLKKHQNTDGSWSPSPISNTALAILAFLAHGETPASKEFGFTVKAAINYLINQQVDNNGFVTFRGADGNEYATLIATYALGEAYGMTKNPNCKEAALKSMIRIIENQSSTGGWDYKINKGSNRDDMSFAGWALQALKACKMAGLHPDGLDECIKKAIRCLQTRNFSGGGFNYTAGSGPTGLTATGCLAMQLLGYGDKKEVKDALEFMRNWLPAFDANARAVAGGELPGTNPQYYCYYAAQCKYQAGMCDGATPANKTTWQNWNQAMKKLYPHTMIDDGTIEGVDGKPKKCAYWKFQNDGTCRAGGDTMTTCLCALQLMVYYRYLPTTKTDAAKVESEPEPDKNKGSDSSSDQGLDEVII